MGRLQSLAVQVGPEVRSVQVAVVEVRPERGFQAQKVVRFVTSVVLAVGARRVAMDLAVVVSAAILVVAALEPVIRIREAAVEAMRVVAAVHPC
jgi:hypothetical protein